MKRNTPRSTRHERQLKPPSECGPSATPSAFAGRTCAIDFSDLGDGIDWSMQLPPHIVRAQQEREREQLALQQASSRKPAHMFQCWPLPEDDPGAARARERGYSNRSQIHQNEPLPIPSAQTAYGSRRAMLEMRERAQLDNFFQPLPQQRATHAEERVGASRLSNQRGSRSSQPLRRNTAPQRQNRASAPAMRSLAADSSEFVAMAVGILEQSPTCRTAALQEIESPRVRARVEEIVAALMNAGEEWSGSFTNQRTGAAPDTSSSTTARAFDAIPSISPEGDDAPAVATTEDPPTTLGHSSPVPPSHEVWEISDFSYENLLELGSLAVCTGLGKQQLQRMRPVPYAGKRRKRGSSGELRLERGEVEECSICLEDIQLSAPVLTLRCNHTFHYKCLIDWLKRNNRCPKCRSEIPRRE